MKQNMKKVPIISLQGDVYHNKEAKEADFMLKDIAIISSDEKTADRNNEQDHIPWYRKLLSTLQHLFTSSS
jgi:hypothetical protein